VIKCLGKEFYNNPDSMFNDEVLTIKPAIKKAIGPRAKQTKDKGKSKKEDEDKIHKKDKKR
jgi:hypothetical protein